MRFMMMVKGDTCEEGKMPEPALMEAIEALAEQQARAGILLDRGGLLPSAKGARVRVAGGRLSVTDGPFTESKELIGGYAILVANSREEAIEMGRRFMQLHVDVLGASYEGELEIRQMFEPSDFAHDQEGADQRANG